MRVIDAGRPFPHSLRDLLEDANNVTQRALGMRLEVEGIRSWDLTADDDLKSVLAELRSVDSGKDVDLVGGLVGGLSRVPQSFHDLGMANTPGRHIVLRAPTDASHHDLLERSFSELSADERRRLQIEHLADR